MLAISKLGRAVPDVDLDHALVELAFAQTLAKFFARLRVVFGVLRRGRHKDIEQPVLGGGFRAVADFVEFLFADHVDRDIDQIADHRFDIAPHITHFREFARLDLHEGRVRELGEAARQFRFADAGGADHQDILRHHVIRHFGRKLLTAQTISQSDGDSALGVRLSDNVLIELAYDFARREFVENGPFFDGLRGKINHHLRQVPRKSRCRSYRCRFCRQSSSLLPQSVWR